MSADVIHRDHQFEVPLLLLDLHLPEHKGSTKGLQEAYSLLQGALSKFDGVEMLCLCTQYA
eukprot:1158298-Pelagomonas_calceolata.AAC.8